MEMSKSNQWVKKKSKAGQPKKIKTPEKLWDLACDYFAWCDSNPYIRTDFKGKYVERVEIPTMRPYTWEGFYTYLRNNEIIDSVVDYKRNKNGAYSEYSQIITRIGDIIFSHNFDGAAVGAFNANLIARKLGIKEQSEVEVSNTYKTLKEVDDEIDDLIKEIQKERADEA